MATCFFVVFDAGVASLSCYPHAGTERQDTPRRLGIPFDLRALQSLHGRFAVGVACSCWTLSRVRSNVRIMAIMVDIYVDRLKKC